MKKNKSRELTQKPQLTKNESIKKTAHPVRNYARMIGRTFVATTLVTTNFLFPNSTLGQFDDLEDTFNPPSADFPPPPPPPGGAIPPPPPGGLGKGGNSNFGGPKPGGKAGGTKIASKPIGDGKDAGTALLTKEQKEKFSRAGVEDITNENFPETIESFDFPNAEVQDIVKAISELTGRNFIVDPDVRGKITIMAPSKITVAEAYKAFLSALAIRGYTLVQAGGFWKIRNSRAAQKDGIEIYSGDYYPNSDQMITRVIQLKYISAELMEKNLRVIMSRDADFFVYPPTNSIIVSDYGANIERVVKLLQQMDVQGFEDQMEVRRIKYAKAKDMAELLTKILNKGETRGSGGGGGGGFGGAPGGGAFGSAAPRFNRPGGSGNQNQAYYVVIPDDRSNSLIIVGNKAGIDRIKKLIDQLDYRISPDESGGVFVYYVKYGDAEKIAQTLSGVAKEAAPKPPTSGGGFGGGFGGFNPTPTGKTQSNEIFGGDVKITADKATNSLVVVASKQDWETVLTLLDKIDIQRDQVYVEAVIMEMKADQNTDWKVGYYKFSEAGKVAGFGGINGPDFMDLISPMGTGQGGLLGFASDKVVKIKPLAGAGAGTTLELPDLLGFLNFLKKQQNANILSTPQIVALDNQEAEIEVGDKVATSFQQTAGTATTPSAKIPNMEEATIKLKIKPHISPQSNSVRLEIDGSVKQPSTAKSAKALTDDVLPLATRKVKTTIVVPNGDTAVIGGLMKENDTVLTTKVPLLGDIPVLGWLFKSQSTTKEKVNMLIFLTPKILRTGEDARALMSRKTDERIRHIRATGGVDPFGETMDELNKTKRPGPAPVIKK